MNYSIFRFTLNMHNHRSQAMVKVFQGDTAVKLIITLTDGGNVYKLREDNIATLTGTKANGAKIVHSCTIVDNTIIYLFGEDTADEVGLITCELTLYDSKGGIITAPKFTIDVDEKEVDGTSRPYEYSAESLATLMGAAAKEYAREQEELARQANEEFRQESYNNALNTANEAKGIAETANNTSNAAKSDASNALIKAGEAKTAADKAVAMFGSVSLSYNNTEGKLYFNYTASDGTPMSVPADLDLERSIVGINDIVKNGKHYLELALSNGVTEEIELDEIFAGVVKSQAKTENAGKVYGVTLSGKDALIPTDKSLFPDEPFSGGLVVRMEGGDIFLPHASENEEAAANVWQVNVALNKAKKYTDDTAQEKLPENEGSSSHRIWVAAPEGFTDENGDEVKYYLKRIAGYDSTGTKASNGKIGIVTKENRDTKVEEGLISTTDGAYENYVEHDEPYPVSIACRDKYGRLVVEDATENFHAVNKRQLDTKLSKAPTTERYKVYGKAKNGGEYMYPVESGDTPTASEIVRRKTGGHIIVPEEPSSDIYAASKKYVDTAVANAGGGGSAKLYLHEVIIGSDYGDEWFDYPCFTLKLAIYRTNNTPITALTDITDAEYLNFRPTLFNLWDAPEAGVLAISVSHWTDELDIEYLVCVGDEYQGTQTGAVYVSRANYIIQDRITEV